MSIAVRMILVLFIGGSLYSGPGEAFGPAAVLGTWLTAAKDGQVTIFKCGGKYCGRITWSDTPEDLDDKNPDPSKRSNKVLGMTIMWGFEYDDGRWVGGRVYDPDSGKTYKGRMWLESADVLRLKGFVGITLLGRTETWTRVK
jgi:uncharacterized protein (DUF2147 family)